MMKNAMIICVIAIMPAVVCYADGLDTLIELGRSQTEMQKRYNEETATYNNVKKAIERGNIKKGDLASIIESKYGQPVVKVKDFDTGRIKWIYKAAKSTFSEGAKACLLFDKNGVLDEVKL